MQPKVYNCVLCEDVRLEKDGRATLLGFVAVAPFPRVVISSLVQDRLSFMFGLSGGGRHKLDCLIRERDKEEKIWRSEVGSADLANGRFYNLIFEARNVKFPSYGEYELVFLSDEDEIWKSILNIQPSEGAE
ncbi:MAG: DUF6941 family protein [Janthinobacterium lividum]